MDVLSLNIFHNLLNICKYKSKIEKIVIKIS